MDVSAHLGRRRSVMRVIRFVLQFLRLGITTVKLPSDPPQGTEQAGALVPNAAIVGALAAIQTNASPAFGNWNATIIPSSLSAATYNANQLVGGIIKRF